MYIYCVCVCVYICIIITINAVVILVSTSIASNGTSSWHHKVVVVASIVDAGKDVVMGTVFATWYNVVTFVMYHPPPPPHQLPIPTKPLCEAVVGYSHVVHVERWTEGGGGGGGEGERGGDIFF